MRSIFNIFSLSGVLEFDSHCKVPCHRVQRVGPDNFNQSTIHSHQRQTLKLLLMTYNLFKNVFLFSVSDDVHIHTQHRFGGKVDLQNVCQSRSSIWQFHLLREEAKLFLLLNKKDQLAQTLMQGYLFDDLHLDVVFNIFP